MLIAAPPAIANESATALQPPRRHVRDASLLLRSHSPTAAFEAPRRSLRGTGHHPGSRSGSRISVVCRFDGHVAREIPLRFGVGCAYSRTRTVCATRCNHLHRVAISAGRSKKRPLTHRRRLFAVRHRLRQSLPASPCGPFMVELFAVEFFARSPNPIARSGRACRHVAHSPRRPRLNEPCGTSTRIAQS